MKNQRIAAILVHCYTGLGMILAFVGMLAILQKNVSMLTMCFWIATFIDSTDGFLARRINVKKVLPEFDGRKLDDIVDFLTYAFLPAIAFVQFDLLPPAFFWVAALPTLASAYGFCQELAKTDDAFVGFPSYWNLVFIYLFIFQPTWQITALVLIGLAILVFIPIHYVYPSRTPMLWRLTNLLGVVYGLILLALCLAPQAPYSKLLAGISLLYAVYYVVISFIHHFKVTQASR